MPVDLIDRVHLGEFDARVLLSSSAGAKITCIPFGTLLHIYLI